MKTFLMFALARAFRLTKKSSRHSALDATPVGAGAEGLTDEIRRYDIDDLILY